MQKFALEFILHVQNNSAQSLKSAFSEFGENLEIVDSSEGLDFKGRDFKISIITEDPTVIFDICSQLGRIRSMKVDETN